MAKAHSVFLVDDHAVVRTGLKELIESMGNYKVTGEFDNGKELTDNIDRKKADIIIMDLTMPVMDGEATMKWLKQRGIETPVLILTLDSSDKTVINLYKLGVRGYLPKTCNAPTLKKAIDNIICTGYFHNELLANAIQKDEAKPKPDTRQLILNRLSEREMEFLLLVCNKEEYTYEQIADIMKLHKRTIDGYREALFEKLDIKSKTGLVLFAIKHGLVSL